TRAGEVNMARKFRELVEKMPPEARAEAARLADQHRREMPLFGVREARALTQEELAAAMGTTQASVSKLERRSDVYLSSAWRYVQAMGGELEIIARFPDTSFRLDLGDPDSKMAAD
ncbi:MAG TPA: helix-turn-helix domain-containing protein, partial [Longimicrobium sp.]|nr:helix-turn-helix domain-containing protein [Longimicrobium sp.]